MPRIQENISLKAYNTFGLDAKARWFMEITHPYQGQEFLMDNVYSGLSKFVLGGGSNVLLTGDVDGIVIKNNILGKEVVRESDEHIWLEAGGGENWHELVLFTLSQNWGGIENLSLIPGSVGAAPIQNIGAYGVEIKDVFDSLRALNLATGQEFIFTHSDCNFGYRDSVFKREAKGRYLITYVTLRLDKKHKLNTRYGAIEAELEAMKAEPSIHTISEAVIRIRQSKLPDPAKIGNAGSFFKNPVIRVEDFAPIKESYPEVPHYPGGEGMIKLPAAWLIQTCGWKGLDRGTYGVHDRQALVLVNRGGAKGADLFQLSEEIMDSVREKFGISLEREVNVIGK